MTEKSTQTLDSEPLAFLVRNPMVPKDPLVKVRPKFPQPEKWLYPAEREDDARSFAKLMRAELIPLYSKESSK